MDLIITIIRTFIIITIPVFLMFAILYKVPKLKQLFLTKDKLWHIGVSIILVLMMFVFTQSILWGACITLLIGLVKEFVWDKWMNKGFFSWLDISANMIGITTAFIILLLNHIIPLA